MDNYAIIPQDSILSMCRRLLTLSNGRMAQNAAFDVIAPRDAFFYARYVLKAARDEAVLDAILADAAENGGPALLCFTNELAGADWSEALEKKGFTKMVEQAGMLIALEDYAPQPADARVLRIGEARLKEWSRTCETSFPKPSEMPSLRYWIQDEACEFYACIDGERIVGTLLGYAEDGNYGIHEVCTLPDCRNRGVCTTLVHHALAAAKAAGNRYASLQASPAGTAVYERCGLQRVSMLQSWLLPHG